MPGLKIEQRVKIKARIGGEGRLEGLASYLQSPWRFLMKTNSKIHSAPSFIPSEAFVQGSLSPGQLHNHSISVEL